jgi:hypothetical protein
MWSPSYAATATFVPPTGAQNLTLVAVQQATPAVQTMVLPSITWSYNKTFSPSMAKEDLLELYFDGTNYFGKVFNPI